MKAWHGNFIVITEEPTNEIVIEGISKLMESISHVKDLDWNTMQVIIKKWESNPFKRETENDITTDMAAYSIGVKVQEKETAEEPDE